LPLTEWPATLHVDDRVPRNRRARLSVAIAARVENAAIRVRMAGMIHRPDRDVETCTARAGRHRQGDGDGQNMP
jgi:hypothetical protein